MTTRTSVQQSLAALVRARVSVRKGHPAAGQPTTVCHQAEFGQVQT